MNVAGITVDRIFFFLLIFTRIVTLMALLPILGHQNSPAVLKVGLSVLLAIIITPLLPFTPVTTQNLNLWMFALLLIKELFVGLVLGFAGTFLFAAVQFAGKLIDTEMGFAFVEIVDPFSDTQVTTMGQLKTLVFSIIFLLINGHLIMILAIQRSFEVIPVLGARLPDGAAAQYMVAMVGHIFEWSLKLAAPAYVSLLVAEVALGVIARTVPQMNVFFVGLPLKITLGLGSMAVALPILVPVFRNLAQAVVQDMWALLRLMA